MIAGFFFLVGALYPQYYNKNKDIGQSVRKMIFIKDTN